MLSDFEALKNRAARKGLDSDLMKASTKLMYLRGPNIGNGNLSSNNTECDTREVEFQGFARVHSMRKQIESPNKFTIKETQNRQV